MKKSLYNFGVLAAAVAIVCLGLVGMHFVQQFKAPNFFGSETVREAPVALPAVAKDEVLRPKNRMVKTYVVRYVGPQLSEMPSPVSHKRFVTDVVSANYIFIPRTE